MRFDISDKDIEQIKKGTLDSLNPLRFHVFPSKEKRKYILACFIISQFEENKRYSEFEVNDILKPIYSDFATVRRFLVDYQFMQRSEDCKDYWLNVKKDEFKRFA